MWIVQENCIVHLKIVNNANLLHCSLGCVNFFLVFFLRVLIILIFFLKTSLEWILYLIIFYLILLHAKNIMEIVVFVECISYVMKLEMVWWNNKKIFYIKYDLFHNKIAIVKSTIFKLKIISNNIYF